MTFIEIRELILPLGEICDHCLGRQISLSFKGKPVEQVGAALRKAKSDDEITGLIGKEEPQLTDKCFVCKGIFLKIDQVISLVIEKMNEQEFNSFLIGCRLPTFVQENEERVWTKTGTEHCEPIKREINRTIGRTLEQKTGKEVDFENPDVVFIVDFIKDKVDTQINSMFIYGRYKKFIRGIPQTKWPCRECRGKGCDKCKGTGKQYQETVEELIAEKVLKVTGSKHSKFHGKGREDVNARMLGNGRPFILELQEPVKRKLDLPDLEKQINEFTKDKVEVSDFRFSDKKEVQLIKAQDVDKTYECLIKCEGVTEEDLKKLEEFFINKQISQRTPTRVAHRRADKIRKRTVYYVKNELVDDNHFKAQMKTQSGTYVKELISGDTSRTKPSFADTINKQCECEELDVIKIHESGE